MGPHPPAFGLADRRLELTGLRARCLHQPGCAHRLRAGGCGLSRDEPVHRRFGAPARVTLAVVPGSSQDRPVFKGRRRGLCPRGRGRICGHFCRPPRWVFTGIFWGAFSSSARSTGGCTRLCGRNGPIQPRFVSWGPSSVGRGGVPGQDLRQACLLPQLLAQDPVRFTLCVCFKQITEFVELN